MKILVQWLVAILVVSQAACSSSHPSDESLLARFEAHETELNRLVEMFEADEGLGRIAEDFTRPEDLGVVGVSAQRSTGPRARLSEPATASKAMTIRTSAWRE